MRKKQREITGRDELDALAARAKWAVLSMCDGNRPYAVPVNVAWDGVRAFIHCAGSGRKLDVLRANPNVRITMVPECGMVRGDKPCDCTMHYQSVVMDGEARILTAASDPDLHRAGLECVAQSFGFATPDLDPGILAKTTVICVEPTSMTGKRNPAQGGDHSE